MIRVLTGRGRTLQGGELVESNIATRTPDKAKSVAAVEVLGSDVDC